ncbi:MAG: methyltransferase domain-containing protein [Actinomycetota bacterium]
MTRNPPSSTTSYNYSAEPPEESRLYGGIESPRHWTRLIECRRLFDEWMANESDRPARVLDVGGGDGYTARTLLAATEPDLYVGADVSEAKLSRAERRFARGGGVVGTADSLPFREGSFETILCLEVLEHLVEPSECVDEIFRVSSKDGLLLVSVPVDSYLWWATLWLWHRIKSRLSLPTTPREHIQVFTKRRIHTLLTRAGYRLLASRLVAFSVPFMGVSDSRKRLGRALEAVLRRVPLNNFGFVRGRWRLSIGRQHLIVVATR